MSEEFEQAADGLWSRFRDIAISSEGGFAPLPNLPPGQVARA